MLLSPRTFALGALILPLVASCGSTGGSSRSAHAEGEAMRMTFVDHRTQQVCELVSESHTDRLTYYSTPRANASTKVQDDEIMGELLEWLEKNDLGDYAVAGPAPRMGAGMFWTLEIEGPTGTLHVSETQGTSPDDKQSLRKLMQAVLQTYNITPGYQAVTVDDRSELFKGAKIHEGATKQ